MSTAAERALDEAVQAVAHEQGWSGVITGWMVVCGVADTTADGSPSSGVQLIYRDGELPWSTSLGLVHGARLVIEQQFRTLDDE